jgi:hydroxymethylglutaryl-CoA reductase
MVNNSAIKGFSKLSKEQKIEKITSFLQDSDDGSGLLKSFWHPDSRLQKLFDEFSENTISNYFFPFGVAPNFMINGELMIIQW